MCTERVVCVFSNVCIHISLSNTWQIWIMMQKHVVDFIHKRKSHAHQPYPFTCNENETPNFASNCFFFLLINKRGTNSGNLIY